MPTRAEHQVYLNAMPSAAELARIESSNLAFCSSGIAARHCLNKVFCIIIVDLRNCLCLYCLLLHSGSSCQLSEGKPIAATSTLGYFASKDLNLVTKVLLGLIVCKK